MLVPLTDSQVYDLCYYLSSATYLYYPISTSYFNDLFATGCRPRELLQPGLWTLDDEGTYDLQPLKGNNLRFIEPSDISTSLQDAIEFSTLPYNNLSYRQLRSVLHKVLPIPNIQTLDKSAIDYVFRYNLVKELHNDGNTDSFIQDYFGWVNPLLPARYYNTILYYDDSL